MPRRNRPTPHRYYEPSRLTHQSTKRAFATKRDAEEAARELQRYDLDLVLYVYQSPTDRKWYLSSKQPTSTRHRAA